MLHVLIAVGLSWAEEPSPSVVSTLDEAVVRTAPSGRVSVAELLTGKNAFIGRLEMDPGAAVPLHRDPTEEYLVVLEGGGVLQLDGVSHSLRAGSVVFMPAGAEVSFQNGPAKLLALQVFAGPESASKYASWAPVSDTP